MNEQILRICELCMKLNSTRTSKEITGNKPTVFFEFSGHTSKVEISIHYNGWSYKSLSADIKYTIDLQYGLSWYYFPSKKDYEQYPVSLEQIIDHIKSIAEKWCDNV